ncbi:MAG: AAA family ATPase [Candidatus Margulisbacteria bacterium]|nr:AAA family ATPase [Candidatus Margulisiibacteriota bacterium]
MNNAGIASFDIPKLMQGTREVLWHAWVLDFFRMIDEVNRMAPETTAILMQAVDRRRVSYGGQTMDMPFGPVYATANYFDAGNFEMTRPFLDRFGISVTAEGLNPQDLELILMPPTELDRSSYAIDHAGREQSFAEIHSMAVSKEALAILKHLASGLSSCQRAGSSWSDKHKSRFGSQRPACDKDSCSFIPARVACSQINEQGITSRGLLALRDYSRALAWFLGKEMVDAEIMRIAFALTMSHRLSPTRIAMNGGESATEATIGRSLFARQTFDFPFHLWDMGAQAYAAQENIYVGLNQLYKDVADGTKTPDALQAQSQTLITQVDAMEDPAKWDILKSLHQLRQLIRANQG